MSQPLRVLLIEDSQDDARLILRELDRAGFDPICDRVETETEFLAHLDPPPDVILADYCLPSFDALQALALARERLPDVPVIVLTGAVDDASVVECLNRGASDYLLKDRLARLGPALFHALNQRKVRADQRVVEQEVARLYHELQNRVGDLQTLLDILPLNVWIGDATAERIVGNRAAYEMIGLPIGTNISLTSPDAREGKGPGFRCFQGGVELTADELPIQVVTRTGRALKDFEQELVFEDGRRVAIQGSVAPLFDDAGKVRGTVGATMDISSRKLIEEELRSANRRKDAFLAALSHELRTPLTPVLLVVSAMLENPPAADEIQPALTMIRHNIEMESRLIDDLLDVGRITQGRMHLNCEDVDVHTLIFRTLETCRDAIQNGCYHLTLQLSAAQSCVHADPVRLQQVFWNLIKNAAKFTPSGGEIAIRSRNELSIANGASGTSLVVEVSDNGLGIEPEALGRIFNIFEQGDSSFGRHFGGLGLGLAISHAVAVAHGGSLSAFSAGKDCGAIFTLSLPNRVSKSSALPPPPPLQNQQAGRAPLRVLLVEDNEDTLVYLARALSQRRYSIRTANNLASARSLAAAESFDLLISDIGLPDGTGLELMDEIKRSRGLPGIAISGFGSDEDIEMSEAAGFGAHLTKPIDLQTLEATMRRVVTAGNANGSRDFNSPRERQNGRH